MFSIHKNQQESIHSMYLEKSFEFVIRSIKNIKEFFGTELAKELVKSDMQCDLIIGNNVFAHVPDINDFTLGIATLLKPGGVVTLEFPHLLRLLESCQFDTIYHEHLCLYTIRSLSKLLKQYDLEIFDAYYSEIHSGSIIAKVTNKNSKINIKTPLGPARPSIYLSTNRSTSSQINQSGTSRLQN